VINSVSLVEKQAIHVSGQVEAMSLSPTWKSLAVLTWDESEVGCYWLYLIDTSTFLCSLKLDLGQEWDDHHCCDATWSPDGSLLAVGYCDPTALTDVSVWIVESATGKIQSQFTTEFIKCEYSISSFTGLRWSVDASRLAVDFGSVRYFPEHWPSGVAIHDAKDGELVLSAEWQPGPEGVLDSRMTKLFVCNMGDNDADLWIIDIDGDLESFVYLGPDSLLTPALSADETELHVAKAETGDVVVVDIQNSRLKVLEFDPYLYGMAPAFDEGGNYIGPDGFDPETAEWKVGSEAQRAQWESDHAKAYAGWEENNKQTSEFVGDWSHSQVHWISDEAHQQDGNRSYKFDEVRSAVIVLGKATTANNEIHDASASGTVDTLHLTADLNLMMVRGGAKFLGRRVIPLELPTDSSA